MRALRTSANKLTTFFGAVSVATVLMAGWAAPAQAADYRRENSATFDVKAGTSGTVCKGWVWVGQTWNGYIEASTSISCPGQQLGLVSRARVATSRIGGILSTKSTNCERSTYCLSSTSIKGSNGKLYCNQGFVGAIGFADRQASKEVCMNT